jgi:hypothetical protein
MSEYVAKRKPRMVMHSLEAVKGKLDMRDLPCGGSLPCAQERVDRLGESIARHLRAFDNVHDPASRLASLQRALGEEQHGLLGAMTHRACPVSAAAPVDHQLCALTDAVRGAHACIATAEREVLSDAVAESLNTLDYAVRIKTKGDELLLRGTKNDLSFAARITKGAELHLDMAGFEGGACTREMDRLTGELSRRGITFGAEETVFHGKKEGGVLSQEIAQEINPLSSQNSGCLNSARKAAMLHHMRLRGRR